MSHSDSEKLAKKYGIKPELVERLEYKGRPLVEVFADEQKVNPKKAYKSKWESLYADRLEQARACKEIRWWGYEAITLVVADSEGKRARYTPDFAVVGVGGEVCFIEVKGFMREAARIRFLAARERYPFWTFKMVRRTRDGGWEEIL